MITIETLAIGQPQTYHDAKGAWSSAIGRQAITTPVRLEQLGHVGDAVADTKNHGGPDKAVCCQPASHYPLWQAEYGLADDHPMLQASGIGENWTLSNVTEKDVCIGDVFKVGSAIVQICAPRYPCTKQDRKLGLDGLQQRTIATLRSGFYLRVLQAGEVQVGAALELIERPHPAITVHKVNQHLHHERDEAFGRELLAVDELAASWKRIIQMIIPSLAQ
ncbi:MAG: MOSC domain-containing protein [Chloroflexi bacterium]|nr:MOSC domain-containing protein [Chloroflexota bacterium]